MSSSFFKFITVFIFLYLTNACARSQILLSGTVYDSTKYYGVAGVYVKSTGGSGTFTDSAGNYHIRVNETDSLTFIYHNKPTIQFPVKTIANYTEFNISLRVGVHEKYRPLKEVIVYSNYRQDSAENREAYKKIFNYERPGLATTSTPGSPPGLDIDELINAFHFRKNKQQMAFKRRLLEEEQDRYINYRFSNILLQKITHLTGDSLIQYKLEYRPSYPFTVMSNQVEFYEYILQTAAAFRKGRGENSQ